MDGEGWVELITTLLFHVFHPFVCVCAEYSNWNHIFQTSYDMSANNGSICLLVEWDVGRLWLRQFRWIAAVRQKRRRTFAQTQSNERKWIGRYAGDQFLHSATHYIRIFAQQLQWIGIWYCQRCGWQQFTRLWFITELLRRIERRRRRRRDARCDYRFNYSTTEKLFHTKGCIHTILSAK